MAVLNLRLKQDNYSSLNVVLSLTQVIDCKRHKSPLWLLSSGKLSLILVFVSAYEIIVKLCYAFFFLGNQGSCSIFNQEAKSSQVSSLQTNINTVVRISGLRR